MSHALQERKHDRNLSKPSIMTHINRLPPTQNTQKQSNTQEKSNKTTESNASIAPRDSSLSITHTSLDSKLLIQSPLNYTGSKFRLLPKLLPLFPTRIRTFVDLFCGGGNVGINAGINAGINIVPHSDKSLFSPCENIILNDKSTPLIELLTFLQRTPLEKLESKLFSLIESFHLSNTAKHGYTYYNCESSKGLAPYNKSGFEALKKSYNLDKSPLKLFALLIFSFNNQMRFNSRGEFNLPCGKRDFNAKMQAKLRGFVRALQGVGEGVCAGAKGDYQSVYKGLHQGAKEGVRAGFHKRAIELYNVDFREFDISGLDSRDFVYIDPPYLLGVASYNENGGWNEACERDLYAFIEELDSRGIGFGFSNVLSHKGKEHRLLAQWVERTRFKAHRLDFSYKNCNYHTKRMESCEVFITNITHNFTQKGRV